MHKALSPLEARKARLFPIANLLNCVFSLLMWEGCKNILLVCGLPLLWLGRHIELKEYRTSKGILYHLITGNMQMFVIYKSDIPVNVFVIGQRHHSQVYFAYWSLVQRSSGTGSQKRARKIQIKFCCVPPYVWIHFALLEETNWGWCLIKKRCLFGSHWRLKVQDQAAAGEDLWSIAWFHVRWIIMQSAWKDSWVHAESRRQEAGLLS